MRDMTSTYTTESMILCLVSFLTPCLASKDVSTLIPAATYKTSACNPPSVWISRLSRCGGWLWVYALLAFSRLSIFKQDETTFWQKIVIQGTSTGSNAEYLLLPTAQHCLSVVAQRPYGATRLRLDLSTAGKCCLATIVVAGQC